MKDLENLEKILDIQFNNLNLLKESLTHRSYLNENPSWPVDHNERLEFLGDAVLELTVTEEIFSKFPDQKEGYLTSLRAALVNHYMLSKVAGEISLENKVFLSKGEAKEKGRAKEVILANAVEALIGAIYLDQGYNAAKEFVKKRILSRLDEIISKNLFKDPKSLFQEISQEKFKITPVYKILKEDGPDHRKVFWVGVYIENNKLGSGSGPSKQEAEEAAARDALQRIAKEDTVRKSK